MPPASKNNHQTLQRKSVSGLRILFLCSLESLNRNDVHQHKRLVSQEDGFMPGDFRDRIREIYIAYLEGHFQFLLDEVVHDEIEFSSNAPILAFPSFAPGKGKAALLAAWKASRVDYDFLNYTPLLVAPAGAETVVVANMLIRAKATNREINLTVADFLQFRDDRIIKFRQFMDSIEATQQWAGREFKLE